jgi:ketosteroid isomerase-like protein
MSKYIAIIKEMYEAFNSRDLDGWSKYFDENTLDYVSSKKEPSKGHKVIRGNNDQFLKGIPDAQYELTNIFGQDNMVCVEGIMSGTSAGTDKSMHMPFCIIVKFEGDLIRERHWYFVQ